MRTALSVVAGFVVWTVLWLAGNVSFAAALPSRFAEDGSSRDGLVLFCLLILSVVCSALGGWLTAKIARTATPKPVWILAVLLLAVGVAVQAGYWAVMPVWYHLAFLAMLIPATLWGGRLGSTRSLGTANA